MRTCLSPERLTRAFRYTITMHLTEIGFQDEVAGTG
jgi:hypothetical protein